MYGGMAYERDELPDLLGNSSLLLRACDCGGSHVQERVSLAKSGDYQG